VAPQAADRVQAQLAAAAGGTERWYAILDGAQSELIASQTDAADNACSSLFTGKLGAELKAVAPRLVDLGGSGQDQLTEWILQEGWGQSWGVFVRTPSKMRGLRKHLRTFLQVKTQSGRKLFFRYFDPRILRRYLPTCTAEELPHRIKNL
jgi:hypothetical protein